MNIYDFDNTIYDGESAVDFYNFCLKKDIKLIRLLPLMSVKLIKYKLCLITLDELKWYVEKYAKELLDDFEDLDDILTEFWKKHIRKIKPFYINQKQDNDIILTATFGFLIKIPMEQLGIKHVLSSEINIETGELEQLCFRENKVGLLKKYINTAEKVCFYTDSMNDKPVIEISDEAYLVKGNKIKKLK